MDHLIATVGRFHHTTNSTSRIGQVANLFKWVDLIASLHYNLTWGGLMARELQIRCLDRLTLHCQEAPDVAARELPLPATLKSQSLFAYLLVHRRRPQGRDHLAELFWGERPERKAHRFLATALWQIRRCLPDDDFILSDTAEVQINPHGALWLDVVEFEKLARVSPHVPPSGDFAGASEAPGTSVLQRAVELYRGDFLDGFYDDWVLTERYRLESMYHDALAQLMAAQEARGEHQSALTAALQLIELDPLREDAHRAAMRAYCRLGQRHAALAQYARCKETLQAELGAPPMAETAALRQAIIEGRLACETGTPTALTAVTPQRRELARNLYCPRTS
jgi:DNA-binding SARP family transcriptional activator